MSFISSFQSFITDPIKQRVGAVVRGATTAFNKGNFGPLAALQSGSSTKGAYKGTLQYPLELGSPTGPHKSWIIFKILETTTDSNDAAGTFNTNLSQNLFGSVTDTINKGVSKVSDVVTSATGINALNAALGLNETNFLTATRRLRSTGVSIALYVPQTLQFNQNNNYSDTSLTAQLGMSLGALQTGVGSQQGDSFAGGASEVGAALSGIDTNLVLFKTTGTVLNPQIEVIFQQTDMRTFQFDFVFAARSPEEQDQVRLIIEKFRNAAAPTLAGSQGRYLIPPSEFDIEFYFGDASPAPMIPKISTCVLTNVALDYAPSGAYATFEDGQPISTRLTLQFKEVELIHKQRIEEGY